MNLLQLKHILRQLRDRAFLSIRTQKTLTRKLSEAKFEYFQLNQEYHELSKCVLTLELETLPKLSSKLHINLLLVPALDISIEILSQKN
jgi:hypothetical protein